MSLLKELYYWVLKITEASICYHNLQLTINYGATIFLSVVKNVSEFKNTFCKSSLLIKVLKLIQFYFLLFQQRLRAYYDNHQSEKNGHKQLNINYVIEALQYYLLIIICLMPVLQNWSLLIIPLILLFVWESQTKWSSSDSSFAFFLGSLIFGIFSSRGWQFGMESFWDFINWIIIAWLISRSLSANLSFKILRYSVFTSGLWLILGFWQLGSGIPTPYGWLEPGQSSIITNRITAVFFNPNIYSVYLVSIIILIYFIFLATKLKSEKLILIIIGIGCVVGLYFTYSRTGWLAGGILLIIMAWNSLKRLHWSRLLLIVMLLVSFSGFRTRIIPLFELWGSTLGYRLKIWLGVINALRENWFWGNGPGSFINIYPWYRLKNIVADHAHQTYLQMWLEYGIMSLITFGLLIFNVIKVLINYCAGQNLKRIPVITERTSSAKDYSIIALAWIIVLFLLVGFSETWYVNKYLGGYFWLNIGLLFSLLKGELCDE